MRSITFIKPLQIALLAGLVSTQLLACDKSTDNKTDESSGDDSSSTPSDESTDSTMTGDGSDTDSTMTGDESGTQTGGGGKLHATITALEVVPNPSPMISAVGTFETDGNKVKLVVDLENCPEGHHGLHIHAGTECGEDGAAAMAHWDPLGANMHGEINSELPHHAGDAAMVECDAEGKGKVEVSTDEWTLKPDDKLNPVGQAVILHGLNATQRVACGVIEADGDTKAKFTLEPTKLKANPSPKLAGEATWTSEEDGKVTLEVSLTDCPAGHLGFHIHAGTACGEDGADAMGHWDPLGVDMHGQVGEDTPHHAGDAGMVECGEDGKGTFKITTDEWKLEEGDKLNPNGHAVIVHDIDAKNRIGCGVIETAKR